MISWLLSVIVENPLAGNKTRCTWVIVDGWAVKVEGRETLLNWQVRAMKCLRGYGIHGVDVDDQLFGGRRPNYTRTNTTS